MHLTVHTERRTADPYNYFVYGSANLSTVKKELMELGGTYSYMFNLQAEKYIKS